jgi:hypothetical protein
MKPIEQIKSLLQQVIVLAKNNIDQAHNFDLEDFSHVLESYVDELNEIGNFETYPNEE